MKGIAIILIGCLLFLGAEHLRESFHLSTISMENSCSADCNDSHTDHQHDGEPCDGDHECLPGCDCLCHFHMIGIEYRYVELPGSAVQSWHYGHYLHSYTYEYSNRFLQPPRFG